MNSEHQIRVITQRNLLDSGCWNFPEAMAVCEKALLSYAAGDVIFPDKVSVVFNEDTQDRINCLPAGFKDGKIYGMKWVSVFPCNPSLHGCPNLSAVLVLSELECGYPIAFIEGTMLTGLRTAAMSALAAKYLAKQYPESVGFIGSGEQAKSHLMAMSSLYPSLRECRVSSSSPASLESFVTQMHHCCPQVKIKNCDNKYEEAVVGADIIVTAISGQEPILKADWVAPGAFYSHVGGYEDDFGVAAKADKIVCDSWNAAKHRTQTISRMYKQGLLSDDDIYCDLYEIVSGAKRGRETKDEFIYYNGVGLSFIDVAIAKWAFDKVVASGRGATIPMMCESVFESL